MIIVLDWKWKCWFTFAMLVIAVLFGVFTSWQAFIIYVVANTVVRKYSE